MKKEAIDKLTIEELTRRLKTQKIMTAMMIGAVIGMAAINFLPNSSEISLPIKLMPLYFLPLVIINIISMRKLADALEARQ